MKDPRFMSEAELEKRISGGYSFLRVCEGELANQINRRIRELETILQEKQLHNRSYIFLSRRNET